MAGLAIVYHHYVIMVVSHLLADIYFNALTSCPSHPLFTFGLQKNKVDISLPLLSVSTFPILHFWNCCILCEYPTPPEFLLSKGGWLSESSKTSRQQMNHVTSQRFSLKCLPWCLFGGHFPDYLWPVFIVGYVTLSKNMAMLVGGIKCEQIL